MFGRVKSRPFPCAGVPSIVRHGLNFWRAQGEVSCAPGWPGRLVASRAGDARDRSRTRVDLGACLGYDLSDPEIRALIVDFYFRSPVERPTLWTSIEDTVSELSGCIKDVKRGGQFHGEGGGRLCGGERRWGVVERGGRVMEWEFKQHPECHRQDYEYHHTVRCHLHQRPALLPCINGVFHPKPILAS